MNSRSGKSPSVRIDATPFLFQESGVGRVTRTLVDHMIELESEFDLCFYVRNFRRRVTVRSRQLPTRQLRLPQAAEPLIKRFGLIEKICGADLYHATDHYLPIAEPRHAVATIHDLIFLVMPNPHWPIHKLQRRIVPEFARKAKRLIAVSEHTRRDLEALLGIPPDKVDVIYPAADRTVFHDEGDGQPPPFIVNALKDSRPYFLAISCSTERKNTPRVLQAYRELLRDDPTFDLVLAWSPPPAIREEYRHERIHFLGHIPEDQLGATYRAASAILYPSLYEGFGLPVLEALCCGTPVITSRVTSLPEVGGDAAIYVEDPSSVEEIRNAMASLEESTFNHKEMRRRSREQADKFHWKATASRTLDTYRKCLEN